MRFDFDPMDPRLQGLYTTAKRDALLAWAKEVEESDRGMAAQVRAYAYEHFPPADIKLTIPYYVREDAKDFLRLTEKVPDHGMLVHPDTGSGFGVQWFRRLLRYVAGEEQ